MNDFRIVVCSLPSHNELVAEIYIDELFVGLVSQEEPGGDLVFEPDNAMIGRKFRASTWVAAVSSAREQLTRLG